MIKIKKVFFLSLLSFALIFFYGCPIITEYPIDEPSVKVDKLYLGLWESESPSNHSQSNNSYRVTKKDDFLYNIYEKFGNTETDTIGYTGHISIIGDEKFLNCKGILLPGYSLYKIEPGVKKIVLREIKDDSTQQFSCSSDVKKFIIHNMNNPDFYGSKQTYLKK